MIQVARAPKVPPAELPPEERYKKAKEICFDLLAVRARTQEELRQALRRKGFDEETSETLLGKLDRAGLVNDAEFAELWVKSRHTTQGLSRTALMAELRRKGVDEQTALRRLLGFLARKGYPQGLAYTVIKEELREYGAESTLLDDAVID
nr:putative regulatory protein [Amycolatopsis mediterranei U32]